MRRLEVEDVKSWNLHLERLRDDDSKASFVSSSHRLLQQAFNVSQLAHSKRPPKNIPEVKSGTVHGLMIDAGSQGTRIHVYEFAARVLQGTEEIEHAVSGKKLSFPTTNSRWTNRLKPGLDVFASIDDDDAMKKALGDYLEPILDFAKNVLSKKEHQWAQYPVYLKATGGMRALPTPDRLRVMKAVRELLSDVNFNPFSFEEERARVISGEEEAIYGWAAVNFVKGTLLLDSEGIGTVLNPKRTYGMLELGGESTQIGYYEPNDDVMANLFKLQIGGARHWNLYAHSFLFFGVNGAFARLNARLYARNGELESKVYNPCLPGGGRVAHTSWIHMNATDLTLFPRSHPLSTVYTISLFNDKDEGDYEACSELVYLLLRKESNSWVKFSHDYDCSFAGVYQPPLPLIDKQRGFGEFIATSNYADVWEFLKLPSRASVEQVGKGAKKICSMSLSQLKAYNLGLEDPVGDADLPQFCFRSLFVYHILHNGYGFPLDYKITFADVLNGQKLGWALGSILYEINTLPWEFEGTVKVKKSRKNPSNLWGHSNNPYAELDVVNGNVVVGQIVLALLLSSMMVIALIIRSKRSRTGSYERIR